MDCYLLWFVFLILISLTSAADPVTLLGIAGIAVSACEIFYLPLGYVSVLFGNLESYKKCLKLLMHLEGTSLW